MFVYRLSYYFTMNDERIFWLVDGFARVTLMVNGLTLLVGLC